MAFGGDTAALFEYDADAAFHHLHSTTDEMHSKKSAEQREDEVGVPGLIEMGALIDRERGYRGLPGLAEVTRLDLEVVFAEVEPMVAGFAGAGGVPIGVVVGEAVAILDLCGAVGGACVEEEDGLGLSGIEIDVGARGGGSCLRWRGSSQ